jgi:hypothetical protein
MSASAGERRLGTWIYDETRKLETGSLLVVPTYRNSRGRDGVNLVRVSGSREQGEARHLEALGDGGVWRASRPNVGCVIAFIVESTNETMHCAPRSEESNVATPAHL